MKKILTSVLAIVLLLALALPAIADANIMYVTRKNVHVFAKADKNSKVIGKVKYGQKLLIEQKKGKFYAILVEDPAGGQTLGWIQAKSLGKNPPSKKSASKKKDAKKESKKESGKNAETRKSSKKKAVEKDTAPDYRNEIKKTLNSMKPVSEYFAEIRTKSGQGSVALRMEPHVSGKLICNLEEHHQLRVLAEGNGWDQVMDEEGGYTGYVSSKFVKALQVAAETPDEVPVFESTTAAVAAPIDENIRCNGLADGEYAAAFNRNDLIEADGTISLNRLRIFHVDRYEAAAIEGLNAGDTLIVSGRPVAVQTVDTEDGFVTVNAETDPIGFTQKDDGFYTFCGDDDIATYTEYGAVDMLLDDAATYIDGCDIEAPDITAEHDDIIKTVMASPRDDFDAFNTVVTVQGGKITEIHRYYTP